MRLKSRLTGNVLEVTPPRTTPFSPYATFPYMMPSKCATDGPFAQVNAIGSSTAAISTPQFFAHPASLKRLEQDVMPTYDGTDKKLWPVFAEAWPSWWDRQQLPESEKANQLLAAFKGQLHNHMEDKMK